MFLRQYFFPTRQLTVAPAVASTNDLNIEIEATPVNGFQLVDFANVEDLVKTPKSFNQVSKDLCNLIVQQQFYSLMESKDPYKITFIKPSAISGSIQFSDKTHDVRSPIYLLEVDQAGNTQYKVQFRVHVRKKTEIKIGKIAIENILDPQIKDFHEKFLKMTSIQSSLEQASKDHFAAPKM